MSLPSLTHHLFSLQGWSQSGSGIPWLPITLISNAGSQLFVHKALPTPLGSQLLSSMSCVVKTRVLVPFVQQERFPLYFPLPSPLKNICCIESSGTPKAGSYFSKNINTDCQGRFKVFITKYFVLGFKNNALSVQSNGYSEHWTFFQLFTIGFKIQNYHERFTSIAVHVKFKINKVNKFSLSA